MPERPTRYYIQYTNKRRWEALHRVGSEPADPVDYQDFLNAKTLRAARKEAERLYAAWEFSQPSIHRRTQITPAQWDYSSELVADDE